MKNVNNVIDRKIASSFSCQVEIPEVKGLPDKELTVGRVFTLACEGPWEKSLETSDLKFDLPKESEYEIKLLGFHYRNANVAELNVTSYVPAEHNIMNLKLTNGKTNIELGQVQFFVKSVLPEPETQAQGNPLAQGNSGANGNPSVGKNPQAQAGQNPQAQTGQPQPFNAIGPVPIQIPLQYYLVFFAVLALMGSYLGFRWYLRSQRKALIRELAEHDSAQSEIAQFHQSLRKLRRENVLFVGASVDVPLRKSAILDLEASFKLYLTRKFRFPAHRWSEKQILREFRNEHLPYHQEFGAELAHVLKELNSIHKAQFAIAEKDVFQISKEISRLVEKLDAWKQVD